MKTLRTNLIISALAAVMLFFACGLSYASKADELLTKGDEYVKKAEASKSSADSLENYSSAIKEYESLSKSKDFKNMWQTPMAIYKVAVIKDTVKGKLSDRYGAHEALKKLINVYDKPLSVLEENLTNTEAKKVRDVVNQSKTKMDLIAKELDKENSKKFQYKILDVLVSLTGRIPAVSYWLAIIMLTVIVKILITPLTKAQFKSMKEMQKIAPLIKDLQVKHKGDQKLIGEKTMELYKEHKINPFAGCLPLLVQMPVLMGLYWTIKSYEFQFDNGTFLWIGSALSHKFCFPVPFSSGQVVWLTAKSLAEPDLILVVLYLISMYISTKMSNVDPSQADQQKMMAIMMPVMFAFIFAGFPSAFLLYWLVFNILQTTQQYYILKSVKDEQLPAVIESVETSAKPKLPKKSK